MYRFFNPSYDHVLKLTDVAALWSGWSYSESDWQRFDQEEAHRAKREAVQALRNYMILAAPVGIISCLFAAPSGQFWVGLFAPVIVIVVGIGSAASLRQGAAERHQARLAGPRTVWFRADGVYEAGHFVPVVTRARDLVRVFVDPRDVGVLHFRITENNGRSSTTLDVRFPIPTDQVPEAIALAERYQREVIRGM